MKTVLIIAAVLGFFAGILIATCARADIPPPDFNRAIYISGPITSDGMGSVGKAMLNYGKSGNAPVSIILNSPGGEVYAGLHFIDMMHSLQAKGITIRCYVQQVAASMAFQIFINCDERYALQGSALLWHSVRTFLNRYVATPQGLTALAADLRRVNDHLEADLRKQLPLDADVIEYHSVNETLHLAPGLGELVGPKWMSVAASIPNLLEVPATVPNATGSDFSLKMQSGTRPHIIYILE